MSPRLSLAVLLLVACKAEKSPPPANAGPGSSAGPALVAGPAPGDGGVVVRFIALGDTGSGDAQQAKVGGAMAKVCTERGCDFVVLLGDNFYPSGAASVTDPVWERAFVSPYAQLNVPFYAVLGNHDYGDFGRGSDPAVAQNEVEYSKVNPKWRMPAPHYKWVVGEVEFLAADTTRTFWGLDAQTRADFTEWTASRTTPWRIVFGHHPYRSNGPHGNAGQYDVRCAGEVCTAAPAPVDGASVKAFLDATVCGKADVYLCGHDHSRQWLASTCEGTELIVSGGGGAGLSSVGAKNPSHWQRATAGFLYVTIQGGTLTGTFYSADGAPEFTRTLTKAR